MSHHDARTSRILDLVAIALEARSYLTDAGLEPTVTDLIEVSRLVSMREMRGRELDFVAGDRSCLREPTVN
jgi:hypothetical protein